MKYFKAISILFLGVILFSNCNSENNNLEKDSTSIVTSSDINTQNIISGRYLMSMNH